MMTSVTRTATYVICCAALAGVDSFAASTYHRVVWDRDPAHHAVIAFTPEGGASAYYVRYGDTTDEAAWTDVNVTDSQDFGELTSYFVRLNDLSADTPVYYRVCDSDGCGQHFWFKTAPTDHTPFVAVAGGDTRTGWETRRLGNILIAKLRPLFVMHGGDYTTANSATEMEQFLADWALSYSDDTIGGVGYKRIYPLVATHGNHEDNNYDTLCQVFGTDYDNDGACTHYDTYGAFNVSPLLRVYTLNSQFKNSGMSSYAAAMNSWLANDLAAEGSSARWRIAQYHKPMFPHYSGKPDNPILFEWWAQPFYDNAMNLVVESDTHMAKITEALLPSGSTFESTTAGGTVYVGEGSWGAPARSADDPKSWTIDLASIQQFKVLTVTPEKLEVRTAQFDIAASTLTHAERENDPTLLPANVNWWQPAGIGEVMTLVQNSQRRSIIDTGGVAPQPPAAPTNLTVTVQKSGKGKNKVVTAIDLNWDDNADNETGFVIEGCAQVVSGKGKNRSVTCNYTAIGSVGADITTLSLDPSTSDDHFRVKAVNDAGESAYSNELSL